MCDRIREGDERISNYDKSDKCISINFELEKCLKENERDFRKCKNHVDLLKICMEEKLKLQLDNNYTNKEINK